MPWLDVIGLSSVCRAVVVVDCAGDQFFWVADVDFIIVKADAFDFQFMLRCWALDLNIKAALFQSPLA